MEHVYNSYISRWGIIGVVEQFILNKVEIVPYLSEVEKISAHIGRLCQDTSSVASQHSLSNSSQTNVTSPSLRIDYEKEYPFRVLKYKIH